MYTLIILILILVFVPSAKAPVTIHNTGRSFVRVNVDEDLYVVMTPGVDSITIE